ncbi:MAG: ATP synthase F0 subunit B, partial [Myxococcota bacterium]
HFHSDMILASEAVSVDLDPTVAMQFVFFIAFTVVMKDLIFEPLLKIFEAREEQTTGVIDEARKMDEKAIALKNEYDDRLDGIRREALGDRDEIRARIKRVENDLLGKAREASAQHLDEGMARLDEEVAAIRTDLEKGRAPLAAEIASKVLGREVKA